MAAFIWSAFFVYAGAQTGTSAPLTEQESAALKELGETIGQKIATRAEAQAICNEEKYLNTCVEIGKKHTLYAPEELKQVDELLAETKGTIINDLEQCKDETCLLEAARRLTEKIAKTKPELAKQFDLTKEKFGEKEKIIEAAKEIGVNFAECKTMDPDTAPVELLRGCARLAKDQRVNEGLSEASKEKVKNIDKSIELSEALKTKKVECGDGTVDGCGNFCLNPGPDARAKGVEGIPQVCRQIAEKFYGVEGIKQLELAYQEVGRVETYIKNQTENLVFKTLDGRKLYNPAEIGKYLETEGKKGNVEAVQKGMDFLLSHGFIAQKDKDFALKMVEQIRSRGVEVDFGSCKANPQACQDVIPDEYRLEFTVMDRIEGIIKIAMQAEGVPDPNFCDDERYGEACIRAAERVLPQIEGIGGNIPEAQAIIAEIKSHIAEGKQVSEARDTTKKKFEGGEGKEISIGGRTFTDFSSLEVFCKTNGSLCLAEVAKQGIISQDVAAQRFSKSYEKQYKPQYGTQDFFGPEGFTVQQSPGGTYGYNQYAPYGPTTQGTYIPGYGPYNTQTPTRQGYPVTTFDKEEALRQFQKWLDNPQGPAPIPTRPQVARCAEGENLCPDGRCVRGSCTAPIVAEPSPRPVQYPCPALSYNPCPEGQTRETYKNENGCVMEGECKYTKPYPEAPYQTITFPYTFSSDAFVAKTYEDAKRHCYEAGSGTGVEKECREKIGYAGPLIKPVEYPTWISHEWRFSDGGKQVSYIFDKSDREYSDYIQKVESQCRAIPQYKFKWKPNAQDANPTNWQNFGIPDCSGDAVSGDTCVSKYGPGWVTRERTTGNCYDSYSTSFRTSQSTLYSCSSKPATVSAPGCTTVTTVPTPSTSTIVTPVYPGDENSCPGFAYSVWDSTGKRYCRLNAMQSCQYSHPAYLTESNYKPENCPSTASTGTSGSGNWVNHLWTFSNGTQPSYILNRTDQEYLDYVKSVETQCKAVTREKFCWKSGAGTDSDWKNFGIPDCSGTCAGGGYGDPTTYAGDQNSCPGFAYSVWDSAGKRYCRLNATQSCQYNYPAYLTQSNYTPANCPTGGTTTTGGGSSTCSASMTALLGTGCHYMFNDSSGKQVYCDGPMTKSAKEGDAATTTGCSSPYTSGGYSCNYDSVCNGSETSATCASDCRSTTTGTTCGTSTCAPGDYCANSTNGWCCPTGMSICSDGRCVWGTSACGTGTGTTATTTTTTTGTTGTTGGGSCTYASTESCVANSACRWMYPQGSTTGGWCEPNSTTGGGSYGSGCGSYATQSSCTAVSGCAWAATYCYSSGSGSGGYTGGGSSTCSASLTALLGTGCHFMYNDSSGRQIYCDGPMSISAKEGDAATTSGCSGGGGTYGSSCPSGWYWNGTSCVSSSSGGTTTYSSDPATGCSQAGGTWNASTNYCQMPTSGGTTGSTGATCTPNQYNGNVSTPNVCNSSFCTGGCNYDSQGCATGCWSSNSGTTSGGSTTCTNFASAGQGCNPSTGTCCSSGVCSNTSGPGTCQTSGAYVPMTEQQLAWACDKGGGDWDGSAGQCERSSFFGSIRNAAKKIFSIFFGKK